MVQRTWVQGADSTTVRNAGHWLLWLLCIVANAAEPHPRLVHDATRPNTSSATLAAEPARGIMQRLQTRAAATAQPAEAPWFGYAMADVACAAMLSGDAQQRAQVAAWTQSQLMDPVFLDAKAKGLTRAAALRNLALAYDWTSGAWPAALRTEASKALAVTARSLIKSMGEGQNTRVASNWQAVRYGAAGLALLASDEPGLRDDVALCYDKLREHLTAILSPDGWNPEGVGYVVYPYSYAMPFLIAAQRAGIGDIRTTELAPRLRRSLWATVWTGAPLPRTVQGMPGLGLRADLSDDHAVWGGHGIAGFGYWLLEPSERAAWHQVIEQWCSPDHGGDWDLVGGGGPWLLLLREPGMVGVDPAMVPSLGLNMVDRHHGLVSVRNGWRGRDDVVLTLNASGRRPYGVHNGPDTNAIRLIGLGGFWLTGGGRTADAGGQCLLHDGDLTKSSDSRTGQLVDVQLGRGTGSAVIAGSPVGLANSVRSIAWVLDPTPDVAFAAVCEERASEARFWRINTPGCNRVTVGPGMARLVASGGAVLDITVLEPAAVPPTTGTFTRSGGSATPHGVGFPFGDRNFWDNTWMQAPIDGRIVWACVLRRDTHGTAPTVRYDRERQTADLCGWTIQLPRSASVTRTPIAP